MCSTAKHSAEDDRNRERKAERSVASPGRERTFSSLWRRLQMRSQMAGAARRSERPWRSPADPKGRAARSAVRTVTRFQDDAGVAGIFRGFPSYSVGARKRAQQTRDKIPATPAPNRVPSPKRHTSKLSDEDFPKSFRLNR